MSGHLAVACSFNAFFRNATKKEAAGAARGGCQVGELGLASAMALVGRGICYGRRNGHGHGSPALVDLEAAPRQSSSTSPSALPAHTEVRAGARSSKREGRSPGERYCSVEDDDDDHDARRWLRRVRAGGSERRGGEEAKRGQSRRAREEGVGAATLTHGSDGGEQQWRGSPTEDAL